ncbi:hypothetical protein GCM10010112_57580 [Actinoplanes lobatus]|uniref:Cytochrome bd-type quinol oxidase subunit 2 n=1 Tax=Actinoplanes lobatus TaxID=113568 RepID=A0A7W7HCD4_9ACTN|nr:hypothetical protein [Actinoplanes lobatus]MBB4747923.1 cytochrome bd-type quinol oxidase subunit 2 [Actinoplanes lobatus]GGN81292.1 hypothetical protein GCM10010112_57580 [Actinoplanes lobatus]GIE41610.1 hypothetical protein Alo02nite_45080 [Actinoplanes lobatus]
MGTVSGLALLTGATASVSIGGGHHSLFATLLLGLLAAMMAHALVVELRRQARRRSQVAWYWTDTVNAVLLAIWALTAVAASCAPFMSLPVRILGSFLAVGYTAACVYFVVERRRAVTALFFPVPAPSAEPEDAPVADSTPTV